MSRTAGTSDHTAASERDAAAALRSKGLRPTRARCLLLTYLWSTDRHPTAEEITSALRTDGAEIGVATVYQNLNRLVDAGLVLRLSGTDGRSRFDADVSPHDHAVCESCGRIVDIDIDSRAKRAIDRAGAQGPQVSEWLVTRTSVEMRGLCPVCRLR